MLFSDSSPTTLILLLITSISLLLIFSPSLPNTTNPNHSLYLTFTDNSSISNNLQILTTRPHIAGSLPNADAASFVLSTFKSYFPPQINSHIASYHVSLTYPSSRTLTLIRPHPYPLTHFDLTQENYSKNPYAHEVGETFHAFAKSGTAVGPVVYANYGSVEDFEKLRQMGVNVSGTVVLARYGKIYRGDIVSNAYDAGALGVLVYTDRKDYGGPEGFPDNKWMPPTGVQVGTVYNGAGDPSTPGWASTSSCERLSTDEIEQGGEVPLIPSLPISADDGELILRSLDGQVAKDDWQGDSNAPVYRVGPGPGILNLTYNGKFVISKIENVIAVIQGVEEPDRFVILGNHRDAWTFGAVDPNSGTAALLDVARRLGKMQKSGWRPRRTIILCNWDAEEYGLIGSTEWVEENREMLASRAVAYLNMDCAVSGPGFQASATPQLEELLKEVAQQVPDPDNSSQTMYDSWTGSKGSPTFGRLGGGGSDYAPFVQHVGVSAIDMLFGGGYPVYHSMYDDFTWMRKFGDPMFQRHVAAASIWGLVALRLADDEFLPFNYLSYANELQTSTKELEDQILGKSVSLLPLYRSIQELKKAAVKIDKQKKVLEDRKGWASLWRRYPFKARELNDRLMMAERAFTDRGGLPGRPWYKHLIYGPSKYNDYGSKSFPGIDDAIEKATTMNTVESWRPVQHEIWRASRAITQASLVLNGKLT
ncbi:probable glutamate carboxypeptidase LAMP1 isoform X1 [Papaver somniferum]|uniref:probable glutamate carboxypeptidase LAMP1 isoform X1 n=1 Tax=Papaver somniferum TaxID=3469 RepID=UPI000E70322C|nr:probable glutamate carboxypeptidase LAMP1 isoform X1 [Papaver somniferum]XP_026421034.1 probable glutamate carboxypeptidase LAMP1 isoform X1 [Papaver somniferum]